MSVIRAFIIVVLVASVAQAQRAQSPVNSDNVRPAVLDDIGIDQKLDAQIPLDTVFRDEDGNAVLVVTEVDYEADGVVDGTERRTSTYDKRGNVISSLSESYDADGALNWTSKTTYSYVYDAHGNLTGVTAAHDFEADGVVDVTEVTTYRYARVRDSR